MNNDDNFKSSRVSTTPFNNNENGSNPFERVRNNNLKNINNRKDNSSLNLPNNNINNVPRENLDDISKKDNINENKNNDNQNNSKNQKQTNNSKNNNKLGQGSVGNNLQNRLNTIPSNLDDAKKKAIEKGTEALKNSANPLAKAAGYGLGAYQKHKNKKDEKDKEEQKEENQEDTENQDDTSEESQVQEERRTQQLLKKILPIIGICSGILLILLVLLAVLSPVITVSSWFNSLFHHKSDDASSYTIYNEKDSENYKAEQDYNNAIRGSKDGSVKGIIPEYQEKYGVTIDWYLLNALITYRYTSGSGNIYSSENIEELDEEELNKRLEELQTGSSDTNSDSSSNDNSGVDYSQASKKIKAFASLMVVKENGSYTTDKEKDGKVYNNVLNSNTFKKYYKSMFKDESEESYKKILNEIYDFADFERELWETDSPKNSGVISDTSIVHVQNCGRYASSGWYRYKTVNGLKVYDNPPTNEGTDYPDYMSLADYLKGTVEGELTKARIKEENKEGIKAFLITAMSYMINKSASGFNLKTGELYFPTGSCRQVSCDTTNGCTYTSKMTSGGLGTAYVGLNRFGITTGQHLPFNEEQNAFIDEIIKEIYGKIMVKKGVTAENFGGSKDTIDGRHYNTINQKDCISGKCLGQKEAMEDSKNGMDYMAILNKYFTAEPFDVIDITEGLYYQSTGENINGTSSGLNENYHYHQGDSPWGSLKLCGSGAISSNGCNITSAAIAISILKNEQITPAILQSRQGSISGCSPNSRPQMIMNFAKLYGLSATGIKKSDTTAVNNALKKLAEGNCVLIVRLEPSRTKNVRYYTTGGHYMAAVGVKTENGKTKLLIWDPGKRDASRDNYWADLEIDLMPNLVGTNSFIVIEK